jgi:hypothetical protein
MAQGAARELRGRGSGTGDQASHCLAPGRGDEGARTEQDHPRRADEASRSQVNWMRDPDDGNVTRATLRRVAALVGRRVEGGLV